MNKGSENEDGDIEDFVTLSTEGDSGFWAGSLGGWDEKRRGLFGDNLSNVWGSYI